MKFRCLFGLHDWERLPISPKTKKIYDNYHKNDGNFKPDIELIELISVFSGSHIIIKNRICLICGKKDMVFDKHIVGNIEEEIRRKKRLDELVSK